MRVLGIDPGTVVVGYGVIDSVDGEMEAVDYGVLKASPKLPSAERLGELYQAIVKVVKRHRPDVVAVEQPFVAKNISSALAIGRAQAVAILAATNSNIPTFEYTATAPVPKSKSSRW
jgi:crossover junction endodeoxyribonuclease RuvC